MIEQLSIQNFQAHTKTKIVFDPAITCITGPSDTGKSAIIRALRWVCTNYLDGTAFITHGSKGSTVKLLIDGKTITRKRSVSGTINKYILNKEEFKALGRRNVPEPVAKVVNMEPVCWQEQHDSPYWFSSSAGEVSRQLNTIINLGVIDNTFSAITTTVNKASTRLEISKENYTKAETGFKELEWVPEFNEDVSALKTQGKSASILRKKAIEISSLCRDVKQHVYLYKTLRAIAVLGKNMIEVGNSFFTTHCKSLSLNEIISTAKKSREKATIVIPDTNNMQRAIKEYNTITTKAVFLKRIIREIKNCQDAVNIKVPKIEQIQKAVGKYHELKNKLNQLNLSIKFINITNNEIRAHNEELKKIKGRMPNICPTCRQPFPKK